MKSVGEVMGIGRNFAKLSKACQSLENNKLGLGIDGWKRHLKTEDILASSTSSWDRIFKIKDAIS